MDIGELLGDSLGSPEPKQPVDLTGLPVPTRAWVFLSNGIQLDADVRYRGMINSRYRGYRIIAELDWETANVIRIEVDRWPPDVQFTLWFPDTVPDERCKQLGRGITWAIAGKASGPKAFNIIKD